MLPSEAEIVQSYPVTEFIYHQLIISPTIIVGISFFFSKQHQYLSSKQIALRLFQFVN